MIEALETLFKTVKDPMWVMAFILIMGLIYSNIRLIRHITTLHDCISTHVLESTKTLSALTTLVEVLVYGRRGGGNGTP
jgi:hypothetical protein